MLGGFECEAVSDFLVGALMFLVVLVGWDFWREVGISRDDIKQVI